MRDDNDRERDEDDEIDDDREPDDVMASLLAEQDADGVEPAVEPVDPEPVEEAAPEPEKPAKAKKGDDESDDRDPDEVMADALKDAQKAAEQSDEWGRAKGTLAEIAQAAGASKAQVADALVSIQSALRDRPELVWNHLLGRVATEATPEQKAQIALRVAHQLGVPLPQNVIAGAQLDQRIAAERRAWEHQAAVRQTQATIAEADRTLADFAKTHPDFPRLRYETGLMMLAARQRREPLSLEESYRRAARAHGIDTEPVRRLGNGAAVGKTVVTRARQATTPQTRAIAARPADPENDDREPAAIMRELLSIGR